MERIACRTRVTGYSRVGSERGSLLDIMRGPLTNHVGGPTTPRRPNEASRVLESEGKEGFRRENRRAGLPPSLKVDS